MEPTLLTRRQFLGAAGAAALLRNSHLLDVHNDAVGLQVRLVGGVAATRQFFNRLTGESIPLSPELFQFEFHDGSSLSSRDFVAEVSQPGLRGAIDLLFTHPGGFEVRVRHSTTRTGHYLRKQISVRDRSTPRRRLVRADLENWQGVGRRWTSMRADHNPFGSHPVYCDDLWAGVEFVAAFNQFDETGFTLRSRPGGIPVGSEWTDLRSTVVGVAPPGQVRDAFLRYIEDVRLAPARIVSCYNSWWTLPKVVTQQDNLALIRQLKADLYDRHGVFFDIITTDMGWSNPRSIWEIDPSILPNGFADIRGIVEAAGGRLGLWMSPSEVYPPVCDYEWAEKEGYVVLRRDPAIPARLQPRFNKPGVSLADPRYRGATKRQLQRLVREHGLGHIKYDGFWAIEHRPHHDLLPGEDSVEPLAAHSLELLAASKEANPELVTEPTYMNSIASYISPWIVKYSDTVWANGEDCVVGLGPAPDYRESHTNAREFMVFQSMDQVWLPQDAVHYFDIVHVDEAAGFPNHAAMAVGRGRFFLSTYINPKLMSDDDWRIHAGLMRWARLNQDLLRHTVIVPSRVEQGEAYMYGHWLGQRGIVVVRNPANENRTVAIDLGKTGAPAGLTDAVCYTQYPYRRGVAVGLSGSSSVALELAPWELLFLEIVPRPELKEPIVLGARWYRNGDTGMSIAADPGVESVRVIEPGREDRIISTRARPQNRPSGEVRPRKVTALPEDKWLSAKPRTVALFPFRYPAEPTTATLENLKASGWKDVKWKKVPSVEFELEGTVTVPGSAANAQILLLVEYPGREHRPSRCTAQLAGRPLALEERHSDEHIGYYNWTGNLRAFESEWSWYVGNLPTGSHQVRFRGTAGHPSPRVGLWLWVDDERKEQLHIASVPCPDPALPPYRDRLEREGVCIMKPVALGG